jgi:hypothetical protein
MKYLYRHKIGLRGSWSKPKKVTKAGLGRAVEKLLNSPANFGKKVTIESVGEGKHYRTTWGVPKT